jgi:UPF0755 protein
VTNERGVTFYLKPNMTKKVVIAELARQHMVSSPLCTSFAFFLQGLFVKNQTQLKTGEYFFPKGSTPFSIWKQMTQGKGLVYHSFTLIPGWSFRQVREALLRTDGIRHTIINLSDQQVMAHLGYPNFLPEGLFYPDTYYYTKGISDLVILKKAFDFMQAKLKQAWEHRSINLPYKTAYEALIVASLIEKEAYLAIERPIIAGVIVNRLRHNMLLQIDPTVIYGMGKQYQGKIYQSNLRQDTAYNTYVHKGLPPTPIAMPGMASIVSAMHPKQHDYFYFVATGDGSHQFSETLSKHYVAVEMSNQHSAVGYFNIFKIKEHLVRIFSESAF